MELMINGETQSFPGTLSVSELLARLAVDSRKVAVECNRVLVPKSAYGSTALQSGDTLEIIGFIGGG